MSTRYQGSGASGSSSSAPLNPPDYKNREKVLENAAAVYYYNNTEFIHNIMNDNNKNDLLLKLLQENGSDYLNFETIISYLIDSVNNAGLIANLKDALHSKCLELDSNFKLEEYEFKSFARRPQQAVYESEELSPRQFVVEDKETSFQIRDSQILDDASSKTYVEEYITQDVESVSPMRRIVAGDERSGSSESSNGDDYQSLEYRLDDPELDNYLQDTYDLNNFANEIDKHQGFLNKIISLMEQYFMNFDNERDTAEYLFETLIFLKSLFLYLGAIYKKEFFYSLFDPTKLPQVSQEYKSLIKQIFYLLYFRLLSFLLLMLFHNVSYAHNDIWQLIEMRNLFPQDYKRHLMYYNHCNEIIKFSKLQKTQITGLPHARVNIKQRLSFESFSNYLQTLHDNITSFILKDRLIALNNRISVQLDELVRLRLQPHLIIEKKAREQKTTEDYESIMNNIAYRYYHGIYAYDNFFPNQERGLQQFFNNITVLGKFKKKTHGLVLDAEERYHLATYNAENTDIVRTIIMKTIQIDSKKFPTILLYTNMLEIFRSILDSYVNIFPVLKVLYKDLRARKRILFEEHYNILFHENIIQNRQRCLYREFCLPYAQQVIHLFVFIFHEAPSFLNDESLYNEYEYLQPVIKLAEQHGYYDFQDVDEPLPKQSRVMQQMEQEVDQDDDQQSLITTTEQEQEEEEYETTPAATITTTTTSTVNPVPINDGGEADSRTGSLQTQHEEEKDEDINVAPLPPSTTQPTTQPTTPEGPPGLTKVVPLEENFYED